VLPHPDSDGVQDIKQYDPKPKRESGESLDWRQLFLETDLDHKIRMYQLSIHDDKVTLFADDNEEDLEAEEERESEGDWLGLHITLDCLIHLRMPHINRRQSNEKENEVLGVCYQLF